LCKRILVTNHGVFCQFCHSCGCRNLLFIARQKETPAYAGVTAARDRLRILCSTKKVWNYFRQFYSSAGNITLKVGRCCNTTDYMEAPERRRNQLFFQKQSLVREAKYEALSYIAGQIHCGGILLCVPSRNFAIRNTF